MKKAPRMIFPETGKKEKPENQTIQSIKGQQTAPRMAMTPGNHQGVIPASRCSNPGGFLIV